jgi:sugar phosphate isomerase/epimerase
MKEDSGATLKAIKEAGYRQVELMDIVGAETILEQAKTIGLEVRSAFFDWQVICKQGEPNVASFDQVLEASQKAGLKHLVFGYIGKGSREKADQMKRWAEIANRNGEKSKSAGIKLCYHNHSFEFAKIDGDKTGYDILIQEFDKKNVHFEVDIFWCKIGGFDPIETLKRLSGRVSQVHLKDLKAGTELQYDEGKVPFDAFQELGNGTIPMAEVLKVAEEIGALECHVEQDQSPNPLASIRQSIQHLRA